VRDSSADSLEGAASGVVYSDGKSATPHLRATLSPNALIRASALLATKVVECRRDRPAGRLSMIEWYVELQRLLREIRIKSMDALELYEKAGEEAARTVNEYLRADFKRLKDLWQRQFSTEVPSYLGRHIGFGMPNDYRDILKRDLFDVEGKAESALLEFASKQGELGFERLLHPLIEKSSYEHYRNGHLRDAVLNSVIATFDHIRELTGISADGEALASKAFSLSDPYIVLSELKTDSGQSDQKGFMQIFKGVFQGIRNPKAHSLAHDLNPEKTAQYLIFASLLVRRLDEGKIVKCDK
jgi:uncharacterized protein (TIGR02391 family)